MKFEKQISEAVTESCSIKKMLLEILKNNSKSLKNICEGIHFQ